MRHETALRLLDELDAGETPGLAVKLHLARCASCSRQARLLSAACLAYRAAPGVEGEVEAGLALEERVMATIRLTHPPRQDFAVRDWLFPAAVILLSMCLVSFATEFGFLDLLLGSGAAIYLSLVLGLVFTAYSALFVASHLVELRAYLQKRGLMPR